MLCDSTKRTPCKAVSINCVRLFHESTNDQYNKCQIEQTQKTPRLQVIL